MSKKEEHINSKTAESSKLAGPGSKLATPEAHELHLALLVCASH